MAQEPEGGKAKEDGVTDGEEGPEAEKGGEKSSA